MLWFFVVGDWVMGWVLGSQAKRYQQTNASWRIQGVCTNAQTGAPIKGAEVMVYFWEPVVFKHRWRNMPPLKTTVVTKTDEHGRFEVSGEGGSARIKIRAEGYRDPEPWEDWLHIAVNGVTRVDTNVALSLQPASKSTQRKSLER